MPESDSAAATQRARVSEVEGKAMPGVTDPYQREHLD